MGADTEGFRHPFRTAAPIGKEATTVLTGELRRHGQTGDGLHGGIVLHPPQEASPGGIVDRLRQMVILHQIADLQVFKGNQVARRDERACLLSGKILTLPLDVQMRSR